MLPYLFYVIYFSEYITLTSILLFISTYCMIRFIKNEACKNYALLGSADDSANLKSLDAKLIQISVNAFRSLVFVLTTINILAIDFSLYPHYCRKSEMQGISLMDTGVGFFILCHSMRYIRNSPSDSADKTIQTYVD